MFQHFTFYINLHNDLRRVVDIASVLVKSNRCSSVSKEPSSVRLKTHIFWWNTRKLSVFDVNEGKISKGLDLFQIRILKSTKQKWWFGWHHGDRSGSPQPVPSKANLLFCLHLIPPSDTSMKSNCYLLVVSDREQWWYKAWSKFSFLVILIRFSKKSSRQ